MKASRSTRRGGATKRGRPRAGTSALTRGRIVAEAMRLIEDEGIEGATMRGVARRLGVDAMSLYNHVGGRDDLLDAVTEHLLALLELPTRTGLFRQDMKAVATALRRSALRHPRCATLVLTRQIRSPIGLVPMETTLAIGQSAGLSPRDSVRVMRAMLAYVVGSLLRESLADPSFDRADAEPAERRTRELEASGLPHVAAAAPHLAVCHHGDELEFGLDLLIGALERRLPEA